MEKLITRTIIIVLFIIGCFYLTRSCGHAWQRGGDDYYGSQHILTIEECIQKIEFHKGEAQRIYDEVKDKCWYLPDLDDRQKARRVFGMIVPLISNVGLTGKAIATLYALFGTYGIDCLDQWDWIQNKWHWLEYHTDQAEFYERYLIHSARLLKYNDIE